MITNLFLSDLNYQVPFEVMEFPNSITTSKGTKLLII